MTAAELKARLLRVVGCDTPASAPSYLIDAVVHAVNHGYQVLWQDVPRDRRAVYTRRKNDIELGGGVAAYEFLQDIQAIIAPIRRLPTLKPLLAARHRSEIESYGLLRGRTTGDTTNGPPEVYWIDSTHQSTADSLKITLLVAPIPAVATTLRVEVELQAPSLTASDLCSASPAALRIPNDYAESLLYPIAAYHLATQSRWFKATEMLPAIKEEYERAKIRAGIVDPATVAVTSTTKPSDR